VAVYDRLKPLSVIDPLVAKNDKNKENRSLGYAISEVGLEVLVVIMDRSNSIRLERARKQYEHLLLNAGIVIIIYYLHHHHCFYHHHKER
jgi:hypothetical protein